MNEAPQHTKENADKALLIRPVKLKVVIQDECCAAWMAINNSFTAPGPDWKEGDSFWNGVLIQMGRFKEWDEVENEVENEDEPPEPVFSGVKIRYRGVSQEIFGKKEGLKKEDFENGIYWINAVVRGGKYNREPPVGLADFVKLRLHPTVLRSLHSFLRPLPGGITFWHPRAWSYLAGSKAAETEGYSMVAGPAVGDEEHSKFTFFLAGQSVDVTVHKFPSLTPLGLFSPWRRGLNLELVESETITADEIVVLTSGGITHGGHDNPPQG